MNRPLSRPPELAMQYAIAPSRLKAPGSGAPCSEQMKREIVRRYRTEQERAEREALGRQRRLLAAERKQLMAQAETWFITLIALTILALIFGGFGMATAGAIALLAWTGAAFRIIAIANLVAKLPADGSRLTAESSERSEP